MCSIALVLAPIAFAGPVSGQEEELPDNLLADLLEGSQATVWFVAVQDVTPDDEVRFIRGGAFESWSYVPYIPYGEKGILLDTQRGRSALWVDGDELTGIIDRRPADGREGVRTSVSGMDTNRQRIDLFMLGWRKVTSGLLTPSWAMAPVVHLTDGRVVNLESGEELWVRPL